MEVEEKRSPSRDGIPARWTGKPDKAAALVLVAVLLIGALVFLIEAVLIL